MSHPDQPLDINEKNISVNKEVIEQCNTTDAVQSPSSKERSPNKEVASNFTLETCETNSGLEGDLKIHPVIHSIQKPFKCIVCGKCYPYKLGFQLHEKISHVSKTGGKISPHKESLITRVKNPTRKAQHVLSGPCAIKLNNNKPTRKKTHICDVCQKSFTRKPNLTIHKRTHTGEKPFICETCQIGFAQKSNLKTHMRNHTGEKPFQCKFCGKSFTAKSNCRSHEDIHIGVKPYKCDICKKRFTTKVNFDTHILTHV